MHVLHFTAENVKRIRVADVHPDSSLVTVSGKNGAGKTSLLDGLFWLFTGAAEIDGEPIRKGAAKARVMAELGDGEVELHVERKFTKSGSTLNVWQADGTKLGSPQQVLDALMSKVSIDPLKFSRMNSKDRTEVMLSILGIEQELFDIAVDRQRLYDQRTETNRELNALRGSLEQYPVQDADLTNAEPKSVDEIQQRIREADALQQVHQDKKAEHSAAVVKLENLGRNLQDNNRRRIELRAHLEELDAQMTKMSGEHEQLGVHAEHLKTQLSRMPYPDRGALVTELTDAHTFNAALKDAKRYEARVCEAADLSNTAAKYTRDIEDLDEMKRKTITGATYPVKGLQFDDEHGATFNGIPFDQLAQSEKIKVSMCIAMAQNPQLRVLRINDGSLLDSDNLATIEQMADENKFQVWVERVDETGKVGIVIEEGQVKNEC